MVTFQKLRHELQKHSAGQQLMRITPGCKGGQADTMLAREYTLVLASKRAASAARLAVGQPLNIQIHGWDLSAGIWLAA